MIFGLLYFAGAWREKWEFSAWTLAGILVAELFFWHGIADILGCALDPLISIEIEG